MIIGARVGERLTATGISQSELARRVQLSQSTISGLIKGEQRSSTKLHEIARELETTSAYLSGETDNPKSDSPTVAPLDSDTRELIDNFADMSPADRRALLQIARSMSGGGGASDTVHAGKSKFKGQAE